MRSWPMLVLLPACFAATPPSGVPCDPAAPACPDGQACIAAAVGFECLAETTPPNDGPAPDVPPPPACPNDAKLSVCFALDDFVLSNPLPNQGRANASAELIDVTRIAHAGGGAAQLGTTSSMLIPSNTTIVDIAATEVSVRLDTPIPDGLRVGLLDTDGSNPGTSMFLFGVVGGHRLRCNIGGDVDVFADVA
ncbi:MAG: hypothetical protein H0V17_24130, partial [Deltaproteobacteria bacterium]|nr:hypothetical protein [Deltaproteobacteria bacterium]